MKVVLSAMRRIADRLASGGQRWVRRHVPRAAPTRQLRRQARRLARIFSAAAGTDPVFHASKAMIVDEEFLHLLLEARPRLRCA